MFDHNICFFNINFKVNNTFFKTLEDIKIISNQWVQKTTLSIFDEKRCYESKIENEHWN